MNVPFIFLGLGPVSGLNGSLQIGVSSCSYSLNPWPILFGQRVFASVIRTLKWDRRGLCILWAVNPVTSVLRRDTQRRRRSPHEDGGRNWNAAARRQEHLELPGVGTSREESFLEPSAGKQPQPHLDFRLLPSPTVREYTSIALRQSVYNNPLQQAVLGN